VSAPPCCERIPASEQAPAVAADSTDLLGALARSDAVKSCLARQIFRSSAARSDASVADAENAFVELWKKLPVKEQDRLVDVLIAFVKSPSFIERRTQ